MFGLRKKNRIVSIELNDFFIRALICNRGDLSTAKFYDYPLPAGIVEEEIVQDEMQFYDIIKTLVKEWGIAGHDLRFLVPDQAVLMRAFTHPKELSLVKLKEYVEMELGQTIHLPFENPLIDIYDYNEEDGEAVLFAAPSEEILKLTRLYEDVQLEPSVLDVRALCNLRFLESVKLLKQREIYLVVDWSVNAVSMSIYSGGNIDFLRYQPIETVSQNWRYLTTEENVNRYIYEGDIQEYHVPLMDQIHEVDRILNFYRFSLHKGEKAVDEIIVMGDNPELDYIVEQLRTSLEVPIKVIDNAYVNVHYPGYEAKHTALIGLSMKGESMNDS